MSVVKRFMRKVALFRARSFPSSLEYTLPFALEQGMRKTATVKIKTAKIKTRSKQA
jgi:hypothetical protein